MLRLSSSVCSLSHLDCGAWGWGGRVKRVKRNCLRDGWLLSVYTQQKERIGEERGGEGRRGEGRVSAHHTPPPTVTRVNLGDACPVYTRLEACEVSRMYFFRCEMSEKRKRMESSSNNECRVCGW
jgi:hypothetical protein